MNPRCGVIKTTKGGKPPSFSFPATALHGSQARGERGGGGDLRWGYQKPDGNSEAHSYQVFRFMGSRHREEPC